MSATSISRLLSKYATDGNIDTTEARRIVREANRDGRTPLEEQLLLELEAGNAWVSGTRPMFGTAAPRGAAIGVSLSNGASRSIGRALALQSPPLTARGHCDVFAEQLYNYLAAIPYGEPRRLRENFNLDVMGVSRDAATGSWYVSFGSGDEQLLDDNPAIDDLAGFYDLAEAAGLRTFGIGRPSGNDE